MNNSLNQDNNMGNIYYVSNNGNDLQSGTIEEPFKTIQKAADIMQSGDTCIVRSGIYREEIKPANSGKVNKPISFRAYENEKVIISGADEFKEQWDVVDTHIYKAKVTSCISQIFVEMKMMNEARWPNTDVNQLVTMPRAKAGKGTGYTKLFDPSLPEGNWDGATVHIWAGRGWMSFNRKVKNYEAGKGFDFDIPFKRNEEDPYHDFDPFMPEEGNNYYLTGVVSALDAPGEWFYDNEKKDLYLWTPSNKSPETHKIEIKAREYAVDLSNKEYITVEGFHIFGAAVNMRDARCCVIDNCHLKYSEHFNPINAMEITEKHMLNIVTGSGNKYSNSTISYSAGNGVSIGGYNNIIDNCILHDINYSGNYFAAINVLPDSEGIGISRNTIYNAGRFHICHGRSKKLRIEYNDLHHAGLLTNDCGTTYAWGTDGEGSVIAYNWVHDNYGIDIDGIYLDNFCSNFIVHNNVVWNNSGAGIRLNSTSLNNKIYNNTILNNGKSFAMYTYPSYEPSQKGTEVYNNIANGVMEFVTGENEPMVFNNGNYEVDDFFVSEKTGVGAYEKNSPYWKAGSDLGIKD